MKRAGMIWEKDTKWYSHVLQVLFAISLVLVCCFFPCQNVCAEAVKTYQLGENVTGTLDENGMLTVVGDGPMYDYEYIFSDGKHSEGITPLYDDGREIKKVVIEEGVTYIGENAFASCYGIEEVEIFGSVKTVGREAFIWDSGLKTVILGEGVKKLDMFCFGHCTNLETIQLSQSIEEIGMSAFYGCFDLKNITLPAKLKKILSSAFGGCESIMEIHIPASVEEMAKDLFGACSEMMGDRKYSLENVYVDSDNKVYQSIDGVVYSKDGAQLLWYPEGRKAGDYTVVDGTKRIVDYALDNEYLKKITLPESVAYIEDYAFWGTFSLESMCVDADNEVYQSIDGVLYTRDGAALVCYPSGRKAIQYIVPEGVENILAYGLSNEYLQTIVLPETVKKIGEGAFEGAYRLENINLPENLEYIGSTAFRRCNLIDNIVIPQKVKGVGYWAFAKCHALKNITFLNPNTDIGHVNRGHDSDTLFYDCSDGLRVHTFENSKVDNYMKEYTKVDRVYDLALIQEIAIDQVETIVERGDSMRLSATISPNEAAYKKLVWSSSDTQVATVNDEGLVTARNLGEAIITVSSQDGSEVNAVCVVSVIPNKSGLFATYNNFNFYRDGQDVLCYDSDGKQVINEFKCDGTYTYYFQADGTAMRDRLTYHPDGVHVIYFDEYGHEVFSDFANVRRTITGEAVNDYCFFDVYGYLYVDVVTYDKTGTYLYYANPYGVMERNKWFEFSDSVKWADGTPFDKAGGKYGYANGDGKLLTNIQITDWQGRWCYLQGNGVALY